MSEKTRLTKRLGLVFGGCMALGTTPSLAQQTPDAQKLDRVEITGSSIKRIEGETALPVQVLTREDIQRTGAATVEQLLQTVGAISSSGGLTAASVSGATTGGISSISLRGLSSLRTLILVNGRRVSPYGIGFTADSVSVDVNSIPLAAIERVEVLKDGASAIYGSDAIAGVVNFILRKDFKGIEVTGEYGDTTDGGARLTRASLAYGVGDLGKDRFNFMLVGNYQKETTLFGGQRDFARSSIFLEHLNDGSSGNTFPANISPITGTLAGRTLNPAYPTGDCSPSVISPVYEFFGLKNRCRFDPSPLVQLVPEAERTGIFASAKFALTNNIEAFAEASYSRNKQNNTIQPVPLSDQFAIPANNPLFNVPPYSTFGGTSAIVLKPSSQYYPTAYMRSLLPTGEELPEVLVRYRSFVTGGRSLTDTSEAPRATVGIKGTAASWDFDASFLYSASKVVETINGGFPLLTKLMPLLNSGRVNFFGPNTPEVDAEARAANFLGDAYKVDTSLTGIQGKASRELFQLPGGTLALAVGGEVREEKFRFNSNPAFSTGDISGYGGNLQSLDKSRNVMALFAEVNIPIVRSLEANAAFRYDDYQGSGSKTTPKVSLRWQPMRSVLVRGAYGKGFRAPSLNDLYFPLTLNVTPPGLNDPIRCPVTGGSNDCATQFSTTNGGNTALKPEESDNMTLGIVLEPTNNISIAVDAFRIELRETIVNGLPAANILADLNQFGFLVTRAAPDAAFPNLPGRITNISQTNINLGKTKLAGFDVDAKVGIPAGDVGRFTVNLTGTYFTKYDGENPDGSFTSAIDTPNVNTGGFIPRWKHYLSIDWTRGPWNASIAQTYQGGYTDQCGNLDDCSPGNTPLRKVGAYEIYDVQGTYTGFKNLRLTLGAKNIFNTAPPFTLTGGNVSFQAGYDPQYADPRGRFIYGRVTYSIR